MPTSVRSVARAGPSSATARDHPCLDERAQGRQDQPRPLHRAGDRPVQREATVGERRGPDARCRRYAHTWSISPALTAVSRSTAQR